MTTFMLAHNQNLDMVAARPLPWSCTLCTFENPEDSASCQMCGQILAAVPASNIAANSHGQSAMTTLLLPWPCAVCTFENPADVTSCEMCGQMRIDAMATPIAVGTDARMSEISSRVPPPRNAEEKRRQIMAWQRSNKALFDAELVEHFKSQEAHRGLVSEAFECSCCMDDVEEYTGIRCAPGHVECEHKMCKGCFVRLVEGQIEKKESVVCPLCPANQPAQVPSWLVGLVVSEQAQAQLVEIEQMHLAQVGGGTLRLWQCPTPDCSNRLALDSNWDARIAAKRQVFGIGFPPPAPGQEQRQGQQARPGQRGRQPMLAPRQGLQVHPGRGMDGRPPMPAPPLNVPDKVPDTAFTASTQRDTHCAYCARLRHPTGWLPLGEETGWLQVDLGENVRLVGLAIQGGFLGTISTRPGGSDLAVDWTPCSYVVPNTQDLDYIVDIEFPPVVAQCLRFDAERFIGESGLRFEVYVTDAPEGVAPLSEQERIVLCTSCEKKICVRCMVEEHAGFTCDAFERWKLENESGDQAYADMVAQGLIKPCPNCNAPILKTEGCNYMTCVTCNDRNGMCWQTGKKRYGPDGCGGGHNCH